MTLRVGWIGCGTHAGEMLLPQLVRLDARLVALCDTDRGRLAEVAGRYGVQSTFCRAEDLLAHGGMDLVGMAVGPEAHAEIGLAAVERGLPVFMEKPPAATAAAAERLAAAAERRGVPVVVGFMKRFATGNRIARNLIADGRFGRVLGIMGWYLTAPSYFTGDRSYDRFFLHHCIHYMDLIPFFGGAIEDLTVRQLENGPGRLLIHLSCGLAGGAVATIALGTVQSRGNPVEFVQVMGDHQRLEVANVSDVAWYRDPPFKAGDPRATLADDADVLSWRPNMTAAANEDHKGYHALLSAALGAVRGEASDAPTIGEAAAAMRTLERMRGALDL